MNQFKHKKKYGQNFLIDNNIINKIIDGSNIDKNTLVIEIGPGQGVMSRKIIPKAKYSILYEIDKDLSDYLYTLDVTGDYNVIYGDFLNANVKNDISNYNYDKLYVVANLPYYINKFIDDKILPDRLVIMVQKEVASRFVAKAGSKEYGSFTVLLNYYYDINKLCGVSRKCFNPVPNVDSSVVIMNLKHDRKIVNNEDFFKKFIRDCFQYKRKNLKNNLLNYDLDKISFILNKHGLDLNDRAENLDLDVFIEIVNCICD